MLEFGAKSIRAAGEARNVITNMSDHRRTRLERKHSVKRGYTVNLGGREIHSHRNIVESAGADPADTVLQRMQHGQKAMSRNSLVVLKGGARVRGLPLAALPAGIRRAQFGINSGALFRGRLRAG